MHRLISCSESVFWRAWLALFCLLPTQSFAQATPAVTTIAPVAQRVHEIVTVRGSGFGTFEPGVDRLVFTDGTTSIEAGSPYVWRDDFIQVRVPVGQRLGGVPTPIPTGLLQVRVESAGVPSNAVAFRAIVTAGGALPAMTELTQIVGNQDVSAILGPPGFNQARTKDAEVGDVDGDGWTDIIDNSSNNLLNQTHSVLHTNLGDGTFAAIDLEPVDPNETGTFATVIPPGGTFQQDDTTYDADLVDITGDGHPDLVQALRASVSGPRVRILLNNDQGIPGRFLEATPTWLPAPQPFTQSPDDIAHTDLDFDGFIDVAIAQRGLPGGPPPSRSTVLFNDGGSTFFPPVHLALASGSTHDVFFLDANADGFRDVVGVNESGSSELFLAQIGGRSFDPGQTVGGSGFAGAAGDLNGDGLEDFVLAGFSLLVNVHLNNPANPGSFLQTDVTTTGNGAPYDVELADVDLDGSIDILIPRILTSSPFQGDDSMIVLLNNGDGTFVDATASGASVVLPGIGPYQRLSADVLDYDRDGDLDLYVTGADGQNVGLGFGVVPNQLFENQFVPLVAADTDADGVIDAIDNCPALANPAQTEVDGDGLGDFDLQDQIISTTQTFEICGSISAGPNFQVVAPGDATFRAGESIRLNAGFSVGLGSTFFAVIETL